MRLYGQDEPTMVFDKLKKLTVLGSHVVENESELESVVWLMVCKFALEKLKYLMMLHFDVINGSKYSMCLSSALNQFHLVLKYRLLHSLMLSWLLVQYLHFG